MVRYLTSTGQFRNPDSGAALAAAAAAYGILPAQQSGEPLAPSPAEAAPEAANGDASQGDDAAAAVSVAANEATPAAGGEAVKAEAQPEGPPPPPKRQKRQRQPTAKAAGTFDASLPPRPPKAAKAERQLKAPKVMAAPREEPQQSTEAPVAAAAAAEPAADQAADREAHAISVAGLLLGLPQHHPSPPRPPQPQVLACWF